MKKGITIRRQQDVLTDQAQHATGIFERMKGLLGKSQENWPADEHNALILTPCHSVHTFFMGFSIDVLFVNADDNIVALYENLAPNRITSIFFSAKYAIEFPMGTIQRWNLKQGERLHIEEETQT